MAGQVDALRKALCRFLCERDRNAAVTRGPLRPPSVAMKPLRVHLTSLQVTDGYAFARVDVTSRARVRNLPAVRVVLEVVKQTRL